MKIICEIEVADTRDSTIDDAIAFASTHRNLWRLQKSRQEYREEQMKFTNLNSKCGSCKYFNPYPSCKNGCWGTCKQGRAEGARTRRACTKYERGK